MAVSKNLMVRVGADLSQLKSGMSQGKGAVREFARSYTTSMSQAGASLASIDAEIIGDKIKEAKKILKDQMNQKDLWAASGITADAEGSLGAAYQELAYSIHETREELASLLAEQQALKSGVGESKGTGIGAQLEKAKAELKAMENSGLDAGDEDWDSQYIEVQRLTQQVKEYKAALTEVPVSIWSRIGNGARTAYAAIASGARTALKGVRTVAGGVKNLGSRLLQAGKTGLHAMGQVAGKIFGVGRSANSASGGMGKLMKTIRNVGIVALGLRFMRGLFGELQGIISSYVRENETLQGQITALKTGMGQALAPAINVVVNAMSLLLPYIIGVSNAIGNLVTNLFGTGWTTVAAGANAAADATKAAAGAQADYNRMLAGFDEITRLEKSGGGGGKTDSVTTPIKGELPTWLTDLSSQIKAAIDAGDWYGIGEILAEKLGEAVDTATAFIESGVVKDKISGFVRKTTSVINGFFDTMTFPDAAGESIANATGGLIGKGIGLALDTLDQFLTQIHWGSIGTTVAQFFNGGIQSLKDADTSVGDIIGGAISSGIRIAKGAVSNFDWNGLGSLIGTSINDLFSRISWAGAGTAFSTGIKGVLGTITTAVQEVDWSKIGSNIKTALTNVDWKGIAAAMAEAAGSALGGIGTAIWTAIKDSVENTYAFFQAEIEAAGGNVMEGIWNGVKKAVGSAATWIKDNIFTPFVDGFKSTFSIHSPSTNGEIVGLGKNVMLGILNGFLEPLKKIGTWVKDNVFSPVKDAFSNAFSGSDFLSEALKGKEKVSVAVDLVKSGWSSLSSYVGSSVTAKLSLSKYNFSTLAKYVGTSVTAKLSLSKKNFSTLSKFVGTAVTAKLSLSKKNWTSLSSYVGTKITAKVSLVKSWTKSLAETLGITSITSKLKLKVPTVSVSWSKVTVFGKDWWYPSGFSLEYAKNAKGGILDGAQAFAMIGNTVQIGGEAGREALLPLDQNTWWMDKIADRVAARMNGGSQGGDVNLTVTIPLDGKTIAQKTIHHINAQARATGMNPLAAYL